jgi:hypothetical protein
LAAPVIAQFRQAEVRFSQEQPPSDAHLHLKRGLRLESPEFLRETGDATDKQNECGRHHDQGDRRREQFCKIDRPPFRYPTGKQIQRQQRNGQVDQSRQQYLVEKLADYRQRDDARGGAIVEIQDQIERRRAERGVEYDGGDRQRTTGKPETVDKQNVGQRHAEGERMAPPQHGCAHGQKDHRDCEAKPTQPVSQQVEERAEIELEPPVDDNPG